MIYSLEPTQIMVEVDFLKEENTKLKRELLTLQENTRLQKKARNKKYYNPKKNWSQFHVLVSDITKQYLFKKIKFITNQNELDSYETIGTLGYVFLHLYQDRSLTSSTQHSTLQDEVQKSYGQKQRPSCTKALKSAVALVNWLSTELGIVSCDTIMINFIVLF